MKAISLDPYNLHTVSRFPGFSLDLSQKCISAARTLKNVNHPMNAKVEQRVIIKFLSNEGADAIEIHHRLLQAFQEDVYTLSNVYEWIRVFNTWRTIVWDEHRAGRPRLDHIDSNILSLFQESESQSIQSLAQGLNVSLGTVHVRLADVLGFSLRHQRWVRYLLPVEVKATRVATSMKMLEIAEQQERRDFAGIITGDESRFFLEYSRNCVWRLGNENAPELISQKIDTEKHLLTIFWSTTGPLVEHWSPTNALFNSTYFCEVIAPCLASAAFPDEAGRRKRRVYLHMDNARPHNSRTLFQRAADNKFRRMPHPPYSPDIAPSDFCLFGTVKQRLQTCEGQSFEELQENVHEILSSIGPDELEATMQAWMERLRRVIDTGGDYV
jgi:hypothetical protein